MCILQTNYIVNVIRPDKEIYSIDNIETSQRCTSSLNDRNINGGIQNMACTSMLDARCQMMRKMTDQNQLHRRDIRFFDRKYEDRNQPNN